MYNMNKKYNTLDKIAGNKEYRLFAIKVDSKLLCHFTHLYQHKIFIFFQNIYIYI